MNDTANAPYRDQNESIERRVEDLLSRMTLEEKLGQLSYLSPAIERLGVPQYNWWSECLHGVGRAGIATVFPQCIGMAASWHPELLQQVAGAIGDEARARYHELAERRGDRTIYKGLTFYTPNVNIFRDPRWGRGHETYGECPYLTGRMGVAFVRGLQGVDPERLKAIATAKHYAVHSGPEPMRHGFDARVSLKDLYETYLPAFRACVVEGQVGSVMGAYNRVNGEACCASQLLLVDILRGKWGFKGYVVSDFGAITDIHEYHKLTKDAAESIALALHAGLDSGLDWCYAHAGEAVKRGLMGEADVDRTMRRLLTARFRLGMFDPPGEGPYASTPFEVNDSAPHAKLALQMARESIVLLKNDGVLPLSKKVGSVLVLGPTADDRSVLLGNYAGTPARPMTILDGVRAKVGRSAKVWYGQGADLVPERHIDPNVRDPWLAEALAMAQRAEVIIACVGLAPRMEGEEGDAALSAGGDRVSIGLPDTQMRLLEALHATGKPLVVVLTGGSALAIGWLAEHVPAIVHAWYGGQSGGQAVADVLWGDYNPAGRLPVTFVRSIDQLPPFDDYAMTRRTYRFLDEEPLYPFGFGLSYTTFRYDNLQFSAVAVRAGRPVRVSVEVANTGNRAGDEVVQLYLRDEEASERVPLRELRGVRRIHLRPGAKRLVRFTLNPRDMAMVSAEGRHVVEPGWFTVSIGGRQPDRRSDALATSNVLSGRFEATGPAAVLEW